jgi:transposase-like protein
LVPKGSRQLGNLSEMIISLYSKGMTTRDISHHLESTIGTEMSHETVSKVVAEIEAEVEKWQNRPLEAFYPVVFLDAIVIKALHDGYVQNRSAHIVVGVDLEGVKHVLGIWVEATEGAKFWMQVCTDLANRGVKDVLIVCADGLKGLPEAIEAVWPESVVQTCVVHLIRASMRWVSYKDRRAVAASLKEIYKAANETAARAALDQFNQSELGMKYRKVGETWINAWERFIPFLAYPPDLRRVIYTTNSIESINYQARKVTKNRGHFPNDKAAINLIWLAISNMEDKRARERAKHADKMSGDSQSINVKLSEGKKVANWPLALQQLAIIYPDRMNRYIN